MPAARALRVGRAVLVGLCRKGRNRGEVDEHLEELGLLAETAGAVVVGRVVQERGPIDAATLVRRGKVEDLERLVAQERADLAIFDDDLSPAQVKNLGRALPVKVVDRSTLIFDIFARRARTREARTQVELAQLRYLLPRLTRQWGHLSRQEGGIGQRGIGETQLELDRRLIRARIARLSEDLGRIETERSERRKSRRSESRVALVGYTNAGKSTVMNLLTGAGALVENRLFATLDPLVRRCDRGGRAPFLIIDTVGFIRKLPHHLVASFRSTLEEAADADLIVQLVDAASSALGDHLATTNATLDDLGIGSRPRLVVFNKIDLVPESQLMRLRVDYPEAVFISALDAASADRLEERIRAAFGNAPLERTVSLAAADMSLLARLCAIVKVTSSVFFDDRVEVRFRAHPHEMTRITRLLGTAEVAPAPGGGAVS